MFWPLQIECSVQAKRKRIVKYLSRIRKVFVHGFPGLYGGAATELHHQIVLWLDMGLEVNLIPSMEGWVNEPLYPEMLARGVKVHSANNFETVSQGDPVFGFCSSEFLRRLPEIRLRTSRTVFANCMTWLFPKEKEAMAAGQIAMFIYQNQDVLEDHKAKLMAINPGSGAAFCRFQPYFDNSLFPFVATRPTDYFGCGRVSRQDADKYAKSTLHIYEYFVAPVLKRGIFLGFDHRAMAKVGKPYPWIRAAKDHKECSQQEFYRHCEIVLQPMDTTENWPRVGLEAMSSGSVLIVDNRGGWRRMVEHGKTGWLCSNPREFIYRASQMAFEPNMRADMAAAAKERLAILAGRAASVETWGRIFDEIGNLPG